MIIMATDTKFGSLPASSESFSSSGSFYSSVRDYRQRCQRNARLTCVTDDTHKHTANQELTGLLQL